MLEIRQIQSILSPQLLSLNYYKKMVNAILNYMKNKFSNMRIMTDNYNSKIKFC